MNWGKAVVYVMIVFCFLASLGYLFSGDIKRSLYFLLAGLINITVISF